MTTALNRSTHGLRFGDGQFESASHILLTQDGDERDPVESLFRVLNADSQHAEGDSISHLYGTQTQSVFTTDNAQVREKEMSLSKCTLSKCTCSRHAFSIETLTQFRKNGEKSYEQESPFKLGLNSSESLVANGLYTAYNVLLLQRNGTPTDRMGT